MSDPLHNTVGTGTVEHRLLAYQTQVKELEYQLKLAQAKLSAYEIPLDHPGYEAVRATANTAILEDELRQATYARYYAFLRTGRFTHSAECNVLCKYDEGLGHYLKIDQYLDEAIEQLIKDA